MGGTYRARRVIDHRPTGPIVAEGPTKADVLPYWQPGAVAITWDADERPARRWPADTVARVRRERLRKRMERKFPLLADQLTDAELAARPSYYNADDRR